MSERLIRQVLIEGARVRTDLDIAAISRAGDLLRDTVLGGHKVLLCGNGGSAQTPSTSPPSWSVAT
ncbi:MAG: hypothetical protein WKG01_10180 [Kofleriaceae bacterium]